MLSVLAPLVFFLDWQGRNLHQNLGGVLLVFKPGYAPSGYSVMLVHICLTQDAGGCL